MPTGHTEILLQHAETTVVDFMLHCAKEFGVPEWIQTTPEGRVEVKQRIPAESYNLKRIEEFIKEIKRFASLSDEAIRDIIRRDSITAEKRKIYRIQEAWEVQKRLRPILDFIDAWQPPTSRHAKFKVFCLEQIHSTLRMDGSMPDREQENLISNDYISTEEDVREYIEELEKRMQEEQEREIPDEEVNDCRIKELDTLFRLMNSYCISERKTREHHEDSKSWISQLTASLTST
jgi:hypothetical protein